MNQKPLRGRISKLAQHRAQPTADPLARGCCSSFPETRPRQLKLRVHHTRMEIHSEQIQEDDCRDSGLEMLVSTLSG